MHVSCVGSDIFGLCFAKGNWQLQYRVQYTSERLLLEMKGKGFYFSQQFGRSFLLDFTIPCCFFLYLRFFFDVLIVLSFIYLPIFHNANQLTGASLFVFHTFQVPSFLIHLFFLFSPFHILALLIFHSSVFPLQPIHLHTLSMFLCVQLDVPPPPILPHMLLFSLSAVTVSLLGNSVQVAWLSCDELFSQEDIRLYTLMSTGNYKLQNTVCSKEKVKHQLGSVCLEIGSERVRCVCRVSFLKKKSNLKQEHSTCFFFSI